MTDEALLAAVARGDDDALRTLYGRHAPAMLRMLRRTPGVVGADDVLQEVWLAVWRGAATFRGEASARAWLLGVCRRTARDRGRGVRRPTLALDDVGEPADPGGDVEAEVLARAGIDELTTAIGSLADHHREALVLVCVEEFTYADAAAVLGVPAGTVKSRVAHARRRLAATLTPAVEEAS